MVETTIEKRWDSSKKLPIFHFGTIPRLNYSRQFRSRTTVIDYKKLPKVAPNYYFVSKDFELQKDYNKGFSVCELFNLNNVGIVTARDEFSINKSRKNLENKINDFLRIDDGAARIKFNLGKDVRDWQVNFARKDLSKNYPNVGRFSKISYRPFDDRWTFYTGNSKGFHCYPRNEVMQHFLKGDNLGLLCCRQTAIDSWEHVGITKLITDDSRVSNRTKERGYVFPLYLYPESFAQLSLGEKQTRTPNLNMEIVNQIATGLGLTFVPEKEVEGEVCYAESGEVMPEYRQNFAPIDLLDYIYAVLHSPTYRETYKEFLKIDFPRVPYPTNSETFWKLVQLGGELRKLHLMESPSSSQLITQYPISGENEVEKIKFEEGKVYINSDQYFDGIPEIAWNFYIGGYQPAQKWLKDRKGRALDFEDIMHYQRIIKVLTETDRVMKEIDELKIV